MTPAPGLRRTSGKVAIDLVEAKIAIPALRPGTVPRSALVERLRSSSARVVLVDAPAGYGKTTLLTQWALQDGRPFAWITLDVRDNDPVSLVAHAAGALDRIAPVGRSVLTSLRGRDSAIWGASVVRLGAVAASFRQPFVIVLDDVHVLRSEESIAAVSELALRLPHGSQLAIGTRNASQLPARLLRSAGTTSAVHRADLALTDAESRELLRSVWREIPAGETERLAGRAEGWAAGLHLAARARLDAGLPGAGETPFGGSDRFVTDYLRSELLGHLTPGEIRFLTRASVLDPLSGPLCDATLGRRGSARTLARFERANLFIFPVESHPGWYRYHPLAREMLRGELERREPGRVAALDLAASRWHEANGRAAEALAHAIAAGDMALITRLVESTSVPIVAAVATEAFLERFERVYPLAAYPAVAAFGIWAHALHGRRDDAERWLLTVDRDRATPSGVDRRVEPELALARALLARDGVAQLRADAMAAHEDLAAGPWRQRALLLLGIGHLLDDDTEVGKEPLAEVSEDAAPTPPDARVLASAELAVLALEREDAHAVARHLAEGRAAAAAGGLDEEPVAALLLATAARSAIRLGDAGAAFPLLARAQRLHARLNGAVPWLGAQVDLELARAYAELGSDEIAAQHLTALRDACRTHELGTIETTARELAGRLASRRRQRGREARLTPAELRLLPLLGTHLSFREIGERLFVSRNTIKTQAISVYRKLGVSSRAEAIDRAVELELVAPGTVRAPR